MEGTITISMDLYVEILEQRRKNIEEWWQWRIPDIVWDYFIALIEDCGINPANSDPKYVVDNIAVNGSYGDFSEFMNEGETEEEFIERAEGEALAVFPEEKYVIWSL